MYPIRRTQIWGLLVVLLLATLTRVGDGAAMSHFRYDHSRMTYMAIQMLEGDAMHWTGQVNSAGTPNSPLTVWWAAVFHAISYNPQVVSFLIGLTNVVAVGWLWWIGTRYFGAWVGFFAALIFAVNPYAVQLSRYIWQQDYMLFFLLPAIAAGLYGFGEGKRWAQVLCLPLMSIGLQMHYVGIFLTVLYPALLWFGRHNISWRAVAVSILLAVITVLPFLYGLSQSESSGESRWELIPRIVAGGVQMRWYPLALTWDLATGNNYETYIAQSQADDLLATYPKIGVLWQVMGIMTLVGALAIWRQEWRRYAPLVLLWAFLTPLVLLPAWTGSGVQWHHMVGLTAGLYLLGGIGIATVIDLVQPLSTSSLARWGIVGVLVAILMWQAVWLLLSYHYRNQHYTYAIKNGQTATPLHYVMDVREVLRTYDDVILLGANPHESNFFVWEALLYEDTECVRDLLVNDGRVDILPAGRFAAVIAPLNPINADYVPPERYTHDDPIIVPLRPGEDPYIIYPFAQAPAWTETPMTAIAPVRFGNGVDLTGYHLTPTMIYTRWQVQSAPSGGYQYYAHFLDADGVRVGQRDAPFYVGNQWCTGDTLIMSTLIDRPANATTLRIGMYVLNPDGSTSGVDVVAEDVPIAPWVDIALDEMDANQR